MVVHIYKYPFLLKNMFDLLKKKLGSWFGSVKPSEKKSKKEKLKAKKPKAKKKGKKLLEKPKKIAEAVEAKVKQIEVTEAKKGIKPETVEKKGFFQLLKEKFTKARISEENFEEIFENLETILLENNVAFQVVQEIKKELKARLVGIEIKRDELEKTIKTGLKEVIENILIEPFDLLEKIKISNKPFTIIFFGVNGSGKTTTIAKLAYMLKQNGISCIMVAADTFRAASIEQLEIHGKKIGIEVIKQHYGADPTAVAFDAVKHAQARSIQAVLIDTAGRMHTKENLMREMEKISRVINPDLKIFIAESITGNDVTEQAKMFNESVGIDGIILSKADVDDKGGAVLSVGYITRDPILYLGIGQEYGDLEKFERGKFLASLGLE